MLALRPLWRMATADTVKRLEQKAKQADETIAFLKDKVDILKKHAVSILGDEEKKLEAENEQLKKDIENMKQKLITMETKNGFKQVKISKPAPAVEAALFNKTSVPTDTAATNEAAAPQTAAAKGEGKKKEKKKGPKQQEKVPDVPVDVSFLDMRIGRIVNVQKHPDADTLYIEEIDCGEEAPRTVVSGLVKHYTLEEMADRLVIVLCNLKPAKMRGVLSQAMVMCASSPEKVEFINPPEGSVPGDRISFEGYPLGDFPPQMNPKKKIFEKIQPELHVNADKVATYQGVPFKVEGKGLCTSFSMTNSGIK
ncbi:aminoacyl tRNA synthase complex-interacting multifunctional protein 1-like [Saccoglossus kowalevskii]|uniref:Aminoacyl tRNA synthase complex-interacting multifunctional protein 1-like n=1 Tax=Saccoglossus kowalevskii TaxID=10224 RepID=A0ABM0H0F9_SACKO|nr:PREDICTED: aminoacyl tRNA synthase complex-interacting multifunctional protein 1-like [Saccoglossus kowalevskii]